MKLRSICIAILSILIIYGLFTGLMYSINLELDSDMVVPGLVANEIFSHGNFQYNFPIDDPYLFTDVYTFHLLPQFLSGYDPAVLRLTAYFMFLLAILVFSYMVYRYAGLSGALLFAALIANVSPETYRFFIQPEYHVGTLIFAGIFIIIYEFEKIKKASIYRVLVYSIVAGLVTLSDYSFLAFFILPYLIYYALSLRSEIIKTGEVKGKKTRGALSAETRKTLRNMDIAAILLIAVPALAVVLKTFEPASIGDMIPYFDHTAIVAAGADTAILTNLPLFLQSLAMLTCHALYDILVLKFDVLDIPLAIAFVAALYLAITRYNRKAKYLYMMFLASGAIMLLMFLFTGFVTGSWAARFLLFTATSVFAVIALAYDEKDEKYGLNTLLLVLVIVLILSTVPANLARLTSLDGHPNQEQYGIIEYLKNHNDTVGFSDYFNSNVITYLSGEQVVIRSARMADNGGLEQYPWLGSNRWYDVPPPRYFILAKNDSKFYGDLQSSIKIFHPKNVQSYDNYTIYQY